jgi:hypothetical protein
MHINEFAPGFILKYNKNYIGLAQNDITKNFVGFVPRKTTIQFSVKLEKCEEVDDVIRDSDLDQLAYNIRSRLYRFKLKKSDLLDSKDVIIKLMKMAYEAYTGLRIFDADNEEVSIASALEELSKSCSNL